MDFLQANAKAVAVGVAIGVSVAVAARCINIKKSCCGKKKGGCCKKKKAAMYAELANHSGDSELAKAIGMTMPYYPFKGIPRFYDIGGLLANPELFQRTIDIFVARYKTMNIDAIGGIDARGFVLGPPIALALGKPFFMLRKKGKMPNTVTSSSYAKEYKGDNKEGEDTLCISRGSIKPGDRVLLIDDLVATGGTLSAGVELIKLMGGEVVECACMIELTFLKGREKLAPVPVWAVISEDVLNNEGQLPENYVDDGAPH